MHEYRMIGGSRILETWVVLRGVIEPRRKRLLSSRPTWMATTSGRRAPQGHPIRHHQAVTPTRPSEAASMAFVWAALVQAIVHAGLEMFSQSDASRTARQFQDYTPESYFPER